MQFLSHALIKYSNLTWIMTWNLNCFKIPPYLIFLERTIMGHTGHQNNKGISPFNIMEAIHPEFVKIIPSHYNSAENQFATRPLSRSDTHNCLLSMRTSVNRFTWSPGDRNLTIIYRFLMVKEIVYGRFCMKSVCDRRHIPTSKYIRGIYMYCTMARNKVVLDTCSVF